MPLYDPRALTAAQLRAARALLAMSAETLAAQTKVSLRTIRRAESAEGLVGTTRANAERLIEALEEAGVEFIPADGGGPGVRLKANTV